MTLLGLDRPRRRSASAREPELAEVVAGSRTLPTASRSSHSRTSPRASITPEMLPA